MYVCMYAYIYIYGVFVGLDNKMYKMHGTHIKKIPHSLLVDRSRRCTVRLQILHVPLYAGDRQICFYPHIFPLPVPQITLWITPHRPVLHYVVSLPPTLHGDTHSPLKLLRLAKQHTCQYALCDADRKCLPAYILNGRSVVWNFKPRK